MLLLTSTGPAVSLPSAGPQFACADRRPAPYALHRGLGVFRFGHGAPALLMPYPHAASVVGDRLPALLIEGLLRLGRQVITFDPPGSGQSPRLMQLGMPEMVECAEEALAVCGITAPVEVLGHSQGGLAALALALERPRRVRCLLLVCTAAGGPSYLCAPGALWNRSHPDYWHMALLGVLYWATRRQAAEQHWLNLVVRDSYVDRTRYSPPPLALGDWLRPAARPRTRWAFVARHLDYSHRLGEVSQPTLVIAGRHDPQMPPACAEELASGLRGAHLAIFERSGHYPFVEEEVVFWETVRCFLAAPPHGMTLSGPGEVLLESTVSGANTQR